MSLSAGLPQHQVNSLKFQFILHETQILLTSFQALVDNCLVKAEDTDGFSLGPELSRAFGKDEGALWKLVNSDELDSMLGPSLDSNASFADPLNLDDEGGQDENDMMLQIS